ncbi:Putative protein of unknown function [Podospora comata]|uniref:Transaldolase n=1 Tax=Podospora comata TaxID=48703 RepID=A0ABY6S457_PODCO|nr:Putative protein of unknown function [Podospora comata]
MGVDTKKSSRPPPLPVPTETESTIHTAAPTGTDLGTELGSEVSAPGDEKSSYSIPDDGTPVTIRAGHRASKSQTSLLIEYFEGGKSTSGNSASADSRKPSVRVRLTPSSKRRSSRGSDGDHIRITESRSSRKASGGRRSAAETLSAISNDLEDASSYASATEESNVSRNPIDIEIERGARRRRPASPLIPAADGSKASYTGGNMSDISAIPTDSFLDGSGGTTSFRASDSKSPDYVAAAAVGMGAAASATAASEKSRTREGGRERVVVTRSRDKERDRSKHKSSKSRTSSVSKDDKYADRSSRRSSKGHPESMVSVADSSMVSSALAPSHRSVDQHSIRSGASKTSSINNPKLLETVEDAIRRLILPELNALKREQSRRGSRRDSTTSSATSASRDDYASDKRRSNGTDKMLTPRDSLKTSKERRDREARNNDFDDSSALSHESVEDSHDLDNTPVRSIEPLKVAAAGAALGAAAVAAHEAFGSPSEDKQRSRRRRRDERRNRSSEQQAFDQYEDSDLLAPPAPPMPLMSDVNASDVTRASILSADTDRPHSASEELTPVRDLTQGPISSESTPTPTRTPVNTLQALGAQHANLSHGDLKALPRQRTGDPDQYVLDDNGKKVPSRHARQFQDEEYDDEDEEPSPQYPPNPYDYYSTQDVPPPLKYVPYQPERRGLSPIPSVSGYTEAGSDVGPNRDSRATHRTIDSEISTANKSPRQDGGAMNRNFAGYDDDDRSVRSSNVDQTQGPSPAGSELDRVTSGQAVRAVALNPAFVHPVGIESNVASLIDASMLEGSALTVDSDKLYQGRESMATLDEEIDRQLGSPTKRSVVSQASEGQRSREFVQYELDEYGRKVPQNTTYRQSPTVSEAAIASRAVDAAAAALRAQNGKGQQETQEEQAWEGAGVQRNRSFKERTQNGPRPGIDPSLSTEKLGSEHEKPTMASSYIPNQNELMPEILDWGYEDDLLTNPSLLDDDGGRDEEGQWPEEATPRQRAQYPPDDDIDYEPLDGSPAQQKGNGGNFVIAGAAALGAAAGMAMAQNHSRQVSQEHDEWYRTSEDRKRDTLVTNPYEGTSPIANLPGLGGNGFDAAYDDYGTRSPLGLKVDEGYISQGPNKTPDVQDKGKGVDFGLATRGPGGALDDPFYNHGNPRHLSGMSQGIASPMYDPATGMGMDNIESRDIMALMQHLMVRDAQRSARDTEILVTLVRSATEMRNNFEDLKKLLADTEDVIITEVKENTDKSVTRAINGPRPYPGSTAARSIQGGSVNGDDINAKKRSIFRRALLGLGAKGTNDLGRIEDMLNQLLTEVDVLKAQTVPGQQRAIQDDRSSFHLQPEGQYEQDHGYEPEGHAGTSTASHPSQSHFSLQSRGTSVKPGYDRMTSGHRISTVPEDSEEEYDARGGNESVNYDNNDMLMTPANIQRAESVPMATPPQAPAQAQASMSNENTPRTEEGKKKSRSSWFRIPKISRWSETTASSGVAESRLSKQSTKTEELNLPTGPSRSGSLDHYSENYQLASGQAPQTDKLHSGFSAQDLSEGGFQQQQQQTYHDEDLYNQPIPGGPPTANWITMVPGTPEDPKYKAHRDSLNLQHPQPRQGQTERFKAALESQALGYDTPMSPKSADWAGSATSLNRFPRNPNRDSYGSATQEYQQMWSQSPAAQNMTATSGGPPRPPKEPLNDVIPNSPGGGGLVRGGTPIQNKRVSKLQKGSPLPHHSVESGYGTMTHGVPTASYISEGQRSPKPENRNLTGAQTQVGRRPSGPRPMTPTGRSGGVASPLGSDFEDDERQQGSQQRSRKRDTFGTMNLQDTDTF